MKASDGMRLYSLLPKFEDTRTWAEIDQEALVSNYKYLWDMITRKTEAAGVKLPEPICVVKADAYGHGARGTVPGLIDAGCRFFAVSAIEEAVEVRNICLKMGIKSNILILGVTLPSLAEKLAEYDVITTVPSFEYAKRLSDAALDAGVRVRVHIKLDTGMNRLGFSAYDGESIEKTVAEIAACQKLKGIKTEGMFTHFAEADEREDGILDGATKIQAERFLECKKRLESLGVKIPFCHMCNSAAAVRFPQLALDGVRLGISLYGVRPSGAFNLKLRPVMALKTKISHIHTLKKGEKVGYGGTYVAESDRILATLPIGYADGFLRAYGGSKVLVSSKNGDFEAPIIGRICMDQCMIDISDGVSNLPMVGDEVTLFGDCEERIYDIAERAGTIAYEVLCAVSSRVIRLYNEE